MSLLLIFTVGTLGAFYGTATGGAGLIIIPTLIFLGLSPHEAVATAIFSYMGISAAGWWTFHRAKQIDYQIVWPSMIIFSIGCAIGSWLLLQVSTGFLETFLGVFIIIFAILVAFSGDWGLTPKPNQPKSKRLLGYTLLFPLGIHNGFMGAGTSTFVTYVLIWCFGQTFLESAGTRKPMFGARTIVSSLILASAGVIHWPYGFTALLGTALGTYLGTVYALRKGNRYVRWLLVIVTVVMGARLLV